MNQIPKKIASLITQIKTFGTFSDRYEIVEILHSLTNGDWLMKIKLLDGGGFMSYRYSEILYDPLAVNTEVVRVSL